MNVDNNIYNQRRFSGVWIPAEIWLNKNLSMVEKGILTEIDSLDVDGHGCDKGNEYFAKFCDCAEVTVSRAIAHLSELKLINLEPFNGARRIIRSTLERHVETDINI